MLEPKGTMTAYARAQGPAPSAGTMHASRPTMAFVFMFVGGILIMIGGIVYLFLGRGFFSFFALLGFVCGTIVVAAAILVERQPARHAVWGTIGLVFALLSLPNFGGFIVGLVLSVVGASLAIAWQTAGSQASGYSIGPFGVPVAPWRLCMGCGRWIPWAYNTCPMCGTSVPIPAWAPRPAASSGTASAANPTRPPSAPPFQAPEPVRAPCPTCAAQAEWVPHLNQWFCPAERRYF